MKTKSTQPPFVFETMEKSIVNRGSMKKNTGKVTPPSTQKDSDGKTAKQISFETFNAIFSFFFALNPPIEPKKHNVVILVHDLKKLEKGLESATLAFAPS